MSTQPTKAFKRAMRDMKSNFWTALCNPLSALKPPRRPPVPSSFPISEYDLLEWFNFVCHLERTALANPESDTTREQFEHNRALYQYIADMNAASTLHEDFEEIGHDLEEAIEAAAGEARRRQRARAERKSREYAGNR